jgi:hypothetical protein
MIEYTRRTALFRFTEFEFGKGSKTSQNKAASVNNEFAQFIM